MREREKYVLLGSNEVTGEPMSRYSDGTMRDKADSQMTPDGFFVTEKKETLISTPCSSTRNFTVKTKITSEIKVANHLHNSSSYFVSFFISFFQYLIILLFILQIQIEFKLKIPIEKEFIDNYNCLEYFAKFFIKIFFYFS